MSSKTLCIFSPAFPSESEPYWLIPVQVFIRAINKTYPDLKLIIFSFHYPESIKSYMWNNNLVLPFNGAKKKRVTRVFMWLRIIRSFYKEKKNNNVIGILSFWCSECTFVADYCKLFFNIKYYCWIFGQDAKKNNRYVQRIKPKENSLIALSDFIKEEFYKNHGIKPVYVIPKGIDITQFDNTIYDKDIDVLAVGSLIELKRYDIFVEIVEELKKKVVSLTAIHCGADGADEKEPTKIRTMIQEKGLADTIKLLGLIEHKETLRLMQRAKILLHPSSYEGFGMVCIEALYAKAHVISFCRPMNQGIKNWHIVKTKEEMLQKAFEILSIPSIVYESVLPYRDADTAKAVVQLFDAGFN